MALLTTKLHIGSETRLYLDDENVTAQYTTGSIKLTIVDTLGNVIDDAEGDMLQDCVCTWDLTAEQYYFDVTLDADLKEGYYRVFWTVIGDDGRMVHLEDDNSPLTVRLVQQTDVFRRELLSPQAFIDDFLMMVPLMNYSIQAIREKIATATAELERATNTFFTPQTITDETHDFHFNRFSQDFWIQQLLHWPIVSITSMTLKYAGTTIATVETDHFAIEKDMGTLEIVPTAASALATLIVSGLSGLGRGGLLGYERIPLFFHITYQAGLDWDNLIFTEQENIRNAVGKAAAIEILPKLDSKMGLSSESRSIDGVSESRSYTASAMYGQNSAQIEQYKKDLELWIDNFKAKYGKRFNTTIV